MMKVDLYILKIFIKKLLLIVLSFTLLLFLINLTNFTNLNTVGLTKKNFIIIIAGNVFTALYESFTFCMAISTMLTLNYLKKTSQIIIILSSGLSVLRLSAGIIILTVILGILNIYITEPFIGKLAEKSSSLTYTLKAGLQDYNSCNIRDEAFSPVKYIIGAECQQKLKSTIDAKYYLKNVVFIEYNDNDVTQVFKASIGEFIPFTGNWILYDAVAINNKKSISKFMPKVSLKTALTKDDYEKQANISHGSSKQFKSIYNIYDLQKIIFSGRQSLSIEPINLLQIKIWIIYRKIIETLNGVMISTLMATRLISGRSHIGITSLIAPLMIIGFFIYIAGIGEKIAINIMSLPFGLVFAPTVAISFILILLMVNK